jgi:putative ABC transport system permease protein
MLKNYLATALREIYKNKVFSAIHVFGLALGIAAFVQILQYTFYERSYENFYRNADDIYRIRQDRYDKGKLSTTWGAGCSAIGPALKEQFPEVLSFGRLSNTDGVIRMEESSFREEKMFAANSEFLTMMPVKLIEGVDSTALDAPGTAVISEAIARKYFGTSHALGKTFRLNSDELFTITGVFRDIPENTHLKFEILISWPTFVKWRGKEIETAWFWDGFYTYIRLKPGTDIAAFEKKVNGFVNRDVFKINSDTTRVAIYSLQPLRNIHLDSHLMWEAEVNGDRESVNFLTIIAFIILIIAWVNYVNLSTVKAIFRSKEVAMRKISGAQRGHLVRQFLVEAFIINLVACLLAMVVILLTMPMLRNVTGRSIHFGDGWLGLIMLSMIIAGPVISGIYPAMVISSFKPVTIFRGKLSRGSRGAVLRKALVVFQFAASIGLIAGTLTVYSQLVYMRNQKLGVNIDQTLIIKGPGVADSTYMQKVEAFKGEMLKYPGIKAISVSTSIPGSKVLWNAGGIRRLSADESTQNQYRIIGVDYDFLQAYDMEVIKGRGFSKSYGSDDGAVLFNEAAVRLMEYNSPEEAIGDSIYFWGNHYKIIGVLKNYHQESLKENYDALIFRLIPDTRDFFSVKFSLLAGKDKDSYKATQSAIQNIQQEWERFFPGNPFDYFFLSDHYDKQYKAEKQFRAIFGLFSTLAIVIACMGLFGLSWFMIVQRTKEIGIRKVNGASVSRILLIVSGDFFRLVLGGLLIAAPVSWYFAKNWLQKFPFRIEFSWGLFLLSGLAIMVISALTISYHTITIARSNPAESIKYE